MCYLWVLKALSFRLMELSVLSHDICSVAARQVECQTEGLFTLSEGEKDQRTIKKDQRTNGTKHQKVNFCFRFRFHSMWTGLKLLHNSIRIFRKQKSVRSCQKFHYFFNNVFKCILMEFFFFKIP